MVLDIETAHAVDWKAIRDRNRPGGFRPHADPAWNDVLPAQVCAVRYDDGVEADRVCTTIHWADRAPFENPYCHLTPEEVQSGCSPETFFEMLAGVASGTEAFVGYNVGFDMGSLRHHAAALGRPLPDIPDYCIMDDAAKAMGQTRWPKLVDAYRALVGEPDESKAHDAEYDVYMTCAVLNAITKVTPC